MCFFTCFVQNTLAHLHRFLIKHHSFFLALFTGFELQRKFNIGFEFTLLLCTLMTSVVCWRSGNVCLRNQVHICKNWPAAVRWEIKLLGLRAASSVPCPITDGLRAGAHLSVGSEGTASQGNVFLNHSTLCCKKACQQYSWIIAGSFCVIFWWDLFLVEMEQKRWLLLLHCVILRFFLLIFRKKAAPIGTKKGTVYMSFNYFFPCSLKIRTLITSVL